jgi:hypothetical protein
MPPLHEHAGTVLTPSISKENIEIETASWIEYYLANHGPIRHVWCSPKDRKDPWVCRISDGREFTVQPKGGVPHDTIYVM